MDLIPDEVLGMVVALPELTGVAGTLSVMAGDSSPTNTDPAVHEVASSGVASCRWFRGGDLRIAC